MGFIPYDYKAGGPDPWEYMTAGALGAVENGLALTVTSGKLAKCPATTKPAYICMYNGTVADGDVIPVIRVNEDTRYCTTFAVAPTGVAVGAKVTLHTDGMQVTATTSSGVAEVCEIRGTAAGDEVLVRF